MELQSFENKKWRSCCHCTTRGLCEWTGGTFDVILGSVNGLTVLVRSFQVVI